LLSLTRRPQFEWVYALIPIVHIQRMLTHVLINLGVWAQPLSYYWKLAKPQPYLVFQYVDILIYVGILAAIEFVRLYLQKLWDATHSTMVSSSKRRKRDIR
jgi:hypothetical protein